ncbi:MAG: 4-amino-4-deoxy-L-arabinose-phospho-UDP flippase [Gammaproteobacteria bacterium]|nr:4-amino-4-deoxy-L-arabinose-phospho-UDP flippase [Gammaproteobacteria bacterium]
MNVRTIVLLGLYALGMSVGQVFFKLAANRIRDPGSGAVSLPALLNNGYFYAAIMLYGILSVLWVGVLAQAALSRAYPFVALAFVFTPLLAWWVFGEPLTPAYLVGALLVCGGLVVLASRPM